MIEHSYFVMYQNGDDIDNYISDKEEFKKHLVIIEQWYDTEARVCDFCVGDIIKLTATNEVDMCKMLTSLNLNFIYWTPWLIDRYDCVEKLDLAIDNYIREFNVDGME